MTRYLNYKVSFRYFLLINLIVILLAAMSFVLMQIPVRQLPFGDCAMKSLFHLYCPGCGGTRAVKCLFRGDILGCICFYPPIAYSVVLGIYYYIKYFAGLILGGRYKMQKLDLNVFLWLVAILLAFFIIRNILLVTCGIEYTNDLASFWR